MPTDVHHLLALNTWAQPMPPLFSFGWYFFAIDIICIVLKNCPIMPSPELECDVIDASDEATSKNKSYMIARLLRDLEKPANREVGLKIDVYRARGRGFSTTDDDFNLYRHAREILTFVSFVAQLLVADDYYKRSGTVYGYIVTAGILVFGFFFKVAPQWEAHRFGHCRPTKKQTSIITRGNSSRYAVVIVSDFQSVTSKDFPDLFDLSSAPFSYSNNARAYLATVTGLFLVFLVYTIFASFTTERVTILCLLATIGTISNAMVVAIRRTPEHIGLNMEFEHTISEQSAMKAMMTLETLYSNVGRSLLHTFATEKLIPEEEEFWGKAQAYHLEHHLEQEAGEETWEMWAARMRQHDDRIEAEKERLLKELANSSGGMVV